MRYSRERPRNQEDQSPLLTEQCHSRRANRRTKFLAAWAPTDRREAPTRLQDRRKDGDRLASGSEAQRVSQMLYDCRMTHDPLDASVPELRLELERAVAEEREKSEQGARLREDPDADAMIEFGLYSQIHGGWSDAEIDERNHAAREWLRQATLQESPNAVFMDNTTLYTAYALVAGEQPRRSLGPVSLLDLATFVRNAVLYDHVFHLENDSFDARYLNEALGYEPIVISVPVESFDGGYPPSTIHGVGAFLANLFEDIKSEIRRMGESSSVSARYQDLVAMTASWEAVLDRQIQPRDLTSSSVPMHWRSVGWQLLPRILEVSSSPINGASQHPQLFAKFFDPSEVVELISDSNHRSLFNARVADLLGLPYSPNAARLPFRQYQYRVAVVAHKQLFLIKEIEEEVARRREKYKVMTQPNLELPVFLSGVLNRSGSLGDFFEVLAQLRSEAEPFRRRNAEYHEALKDGETGGQELEAMRRALRDDARAWRGALVAPAAAGLAAVLAAASGPTAGLTLAGIGLLTSVGQLAPERREAVIRRFLRPDEWFLTRTADTASALRTSLPDVQRLWGATDAELNGYAARFDRFSKLGYA